MQKCDENITCTSMLYLENKMYSLHIEQNYTPSASISADCFSHKEIWKK